MITQLTVSQNGIVSDHGAKFQRIVTFDRLPMIRMLMFHSIALIARSRLRRPMRDLNE